MGILLLFVLIAAAARTLNEYVIGELTQPSVELKESIFLGICGLVVVLVWRYVPSSVQTQGHDSGTTI